MLMLSRRHNINMGSIWIRDQTVYAYMMKHDGDREAAIEEIKKVVEDNAPEVDE